MTVAAAAGPGDWRPGLPVECGTYSAVGRLLRNDQGQVVVVTASGSAEPFEFILLGGSAKEKARSLGAIVALELEVRKRILPGAVPATYLKRFVPLTEASGDVGAPYLRVVSAEKCR